MQVFLRHRVPRFAVASARHGARGQLLRGITFRLLALIVAWNYFSFQVEPFEEEYERNNPLPSSTPAFADWPWNWESFGKNNVPSAQNFVAFIAFVPLAPFHVPAETQRPEHPPFLRIRDKSPPAPASSR